MKTKSIGWAYPSSTAAAKFGFKKSGCWVISTSTNEKPPVYHAGFISREAAFQAAAARPETWCRHFIRWNPDLSARIDQESGKVYDLAIHSVAANVAMVCVISDKLEERSQIIVRAQSESSLIGKLFEEFHLMPCPKKSGVFRTSEECARIRETMKAAG